MQPTEASARDAKSNSTSRSIGGVSLKVRKDIASASAPTPVAIQKSSRQSPRPAKAPPITGPIATAPKIPMFITIAVERKRGVGKPSTSAGAAVISIRLVISPCTTRPMKKGAGALAVAVATEARVKTAA